MERFRLQIKEEEAHRQSPNGQSRGYGTDEYGPFPGKASGEDALRSSPRRGAQDFSRWLYLSLLRFTERLQNVFHDILSQSNGIELNAQDGMARRATETNCVPASGDWFLSAD